MMLQKHIVVLCLLLSTGTAFAGHGFRDWISGASTWEDPAKISQLSPESKRIVEETLRDLPGVIDTHLHLICREAKNSCFIPQKLFSPASHPLSSFKAQVVLSALGIVDDKESDAQLVDRLEKLIRNFPSKPYIGMLFAYTASYDRDTHKKNLEKTGLEVPNAYMQQVVDRNARSLIPVYSLHPYQEGLEKGFEALKNPRFFKVLPNSMNFSPADEQCAGFFEMLAKHESILITHAGAEHSIEGGGINDKFGNPLLYEKWLQRFPKLRIIFAHVGGAGRSPSHDREEEDNFKIVLQLLRKYPQQTFADISAFSLAPNLVKFLPTLLEETAIHSQLLYGSDYPLVAIKPMLSTTLWAMYWKGLFGGWMEFRTAYRAIMEIYNYNPLLSSFVTMRWISKKGKRLPPEIFFENARRLLGSVPNVEMERMK